MWCGVGEDNVGGSKILLTLHGEIYTCAKTKKRGTSRYRKY